MYGVFLRAQTVIRWAGSKRKLVPLLKANLPEKFERYVEPFCGSACLFFELDAAKPALLSDINAELINALDEIKFSPSIRDELLKIPNTEEEYYRLRKIDPQGLTKTKRAVRFLYLNRYCFNGVYRTNRLGQFNVPRGNRTGDFPSYNAFLLAHERLTNSELMVADYKAAFRMLRKGDFVYIDPPYAKSNKFTGEYGVGSFNGENLPSLFDELITLDKAGVLFLFSYRACDEIIKYLNQYFNVQVLSVRRHISGFKTNWQETQEILVKNYE